MGQTKCMWLHVAHDSGRMPTSIGVGVSMHVKRVRRWQPQNNAVAVNLNRASIEKTRATEKEMRGGYMALRDTGRTACQGSLIGERHAPHLGVAVTMWRHRIIVGGSTQHMYKGVRPQQEQQRIPCVVR